MGSLWPYREALQAAAAGEGLTFTAGTSPKERARLELEPGLRRYEFDVVLSGADIAIEDPMESIRHMFQSKDGVRLPDPTGRAAAEIRKETFDLQAVNAVLWDDAIVWPTAHYSRGIWAKPRVDLTDLNTSTFPPGMQWLAIAR